MKEIFAALVSVYKGSQLESLTGQGKFYSYYVPESASPPYVVATMAPSQISRVMSGTAKIEPMIYITGVSDFSKGQAEINNLKDKILETFDGADPVVEGYRLVNLEAVELQQVLDVDDPDEPLWNYPVKFKISIE